MFYDNFVSIKSKIGVEYRRYAVGYKNLKSFEDFYKTIESFHHLSALPFVIFYLDDEGIPLPINNSINLAKAIKSAKLISSYSKGHYCNNNNNNNNNIVEPTIARVRPYLKLIIEKKENYLYHNGNLPGKYKKKQNSRGFISDQSPRPAIGVPEDFRKVSSIIDVHEVPATLRRVRINKHGSGRPLGFYIRDGTYRRINSRGHVEVVMGIFISRLVPGGLAESTGLLAVNDEVLEVNGIQVNQGKTLEQVTDMMVANSSNLIITIRPGINNLN